MGESMQPRVSRVLWAALAILPSEQRRIGARPLGRESRRARQGADSKVISMPQAAGAVIKALRGISLLLLAAGVLAGCASPLSPREQATVSSYLLEWEPPSSTGTANSEGPSLLVSGIRAAAGYGGSDMLYVRTPHQLERYANHRWVDAPARMLDPLIIGACERSGLFAVVSGPGKAVRADLRLESELLHLRQLFGDASSRVELAMRFSLLDLASGRVLTSKTMELSEPVEENTPYGAVIAANRAVGRLLSGLQLLLGESLKKTGG